MGKPVIIILLVSLFISCEKEINYVSRLISLESFEQVDLKDYFDVYLSEGSKFSMEMRGDEDILEYIEYAVENNILSIENNRKVKWISPGRDKVEIYITSPSLQSVEASDGCNIQTLNPLTSEEFGLILKRKSNQARLELNNNTFYYWNYFPTGGKVSLTGQTENLKIWNYAIMSVDAKELTSKNAFIENSSKGDCEVTVLNRLEYSIGGEGNILLWGDPKEIIERDRSSSGRLIRY